MRQLLRRNCKVLFLLLFLSLLAPVSHAAGPSTNLNPCLGVLSGFRGIDSTNRVTYVQCADGLVVGTFNCPTGTYFREDIGTCEVGIWVDDTPLGGAATAAPPGGPAGSTETAVTTVMATTAVYVTDAPQRNDPAPTTSNESCEQVVNGNIALTSLSGYLVCSDGNVLVTQYCGKDTLYDARTDTCRNYCLGSYRDPPIRSVVLPQLAGHVTCQSDSPSQVIVCSSGTHYDVQSGRCRDFCSDALTDSEYVPFPGNTGGVTCIQKSLMEVTFCRSGHRFDTEFGMCFETTAPTTSPTSSAPTFFPTTSSPVRAPTAAPSIQTTSQTQLPTAALELVVPIDIQTNETESGGRKKTVIINVEYDSSFASSRGHWIWISILIMCHFF